MDKLLKVFELRLHWLQYSEALFYIWQGMSICDIVSYERKNSRAATLLFFMPVTKDNVLYSSYFNWHNSIEYSTIPLYLKYELWMGIKVYRSCFQRVAGWCEAIEVVRWHSPVSFGGEYSSSHRRWFRYTRNESQLGWYRVMNITPLWATTVVLRGFFIVKV